MSIPFGKAWLGELRTGQHPAAGYLEKVAASWSRTLGRCQTVPPWDWRLGEALTDQWAKNQMTNHSSRMPVSRQGGPVAAVPDMGDSMHFCRYTTAKSFPATALAIIVKLPAKNC